ncbi:MAG: hypothetical protein HY906_26720 [Deltaproteobacteria bacterium]|nr:hypothetical protein [Deltaproteobacteria bacterium]
MDTFKAGFKFEEKLTGTYHLLSRPEEEKAFSFTAQAAVANVVKYLQDMSATLQGTVEMEGFADQAPLSGSLELNPLFGRVLRYQFTFVANDGKTYRFAGQKDIQLLDLPGSMTTLPGAVYDESGNEIARVLTRFDLGSDLVPFLLSWRPVLPFLG